MYSEVGEAIDAEKSLMRIAKLMDDDGLADVVHFDAVEIEKIDEKMTNIIFLRLFFLGRLKFMIILLAEGLSPSK